ncbi:ASC protein, partial [Amia calva]|nr:ASC protein [Amia calva]
MSKTIQDHITDALEELTERDLKKFKNKLCDRLGEPKIRKGVIETAEPADLAHKIVRTYTECKAAPVTVEVLQAIDENQIAEELRQNTIACK